MEAFYKWFLLSFNANAIQDYALHGKLKPYSVVSKDISLILKIRA